MVHKLAMKLLNDWCKLCCLFVTLLVTAAKTKSEVVHRVELHNISILVMAPSPGNLTRGWEEGPAVIPAARLAVKEINNSTDILSGFTLQLMEANSGCSIVSEAIISFVRDLYNCKEPVVGIVGPGCSEAALQISSLTSRYEVSLLHITPSATSPQLEDAARNTTFATISSALSFVQSYLELMEYNNWTRVATLRDVSRGYFLETHSRFFSTVNSSKVIYTGDLYRGIQSFIPLGALKTSGARVVLVFAGADIAIQLVCYAYYRGITYPSYQLVFHDIEKGELIKDVPGFHVDGETKAIACTKEEMVAATDGVILNLFHLVQEDDDTILPIFNKTYRDYFEDYKKELELYRIEHDLKEQIPPSVYGNSYHDAVWAMALALHNASLDGVDLRSYTHNKKNSDTIEIAGHLQEVVFSGMSGPIVFRNDTRSTVSVISIKILWKGEEVLLGTFKRFHGRKMTIFPSMDRYFISDTFQRHRVTIHVVLCVLVSLLTLVMIAVGVLLQLMYVIWRHYHTIKATSPKVSHLIFFGCYLLAIDVLILSIQETLPDISPESYSGLCIAFTWCFMLGYTLIFGTVLVKIWRVCRLFRHFRNERPRNCLSDNSLISFVILLLLVDVCICISWTVIDPWTSSTTILTTETSELNVRLNCTCEHLVVWISILSVSKGSLLLMLVILSIMNRRIKKKNFQHTRKVNTLIYGNIMVVAIGFPLYFLLNDRNIYIGFLCLCTILLSTHCLCCFTLILPPVLPIIKLEFRSRRHQTTLPMKNMGVQLFLDILRFLRPTHVIRLRQDGTMISDTLKELPPLTESFLSRTPGLFTPADKPTSTSEPLDPAPYNTLDKIGEMTPPLPTSAESDNVGYCSSDGSSEDESSISQSSESEDMISHDHASPREERIRRKRKLRRHRLYRINARLNNEKKRALEKNRYVPVVLVKEWEQILFFKSKCVASPKIAAKNSKWQRTLGLMAHLSPLLPVAQSIAKKHCLPNPHENMLSYSPPLEVPWKDVAIHILHKPVPTEYILYAFNGKLICLGQALPEQIMDYNGSGENMFKVLKSQAPLIQFLGLGLLRGIDPVKKLFYVSTAVTASNLEMVNVLVLGNIDQTGVEASTPLYSEGRIPYQAEKYQPTELGKYVWNCTKSRV